MTLSAHCLVRNEGRFVWYAVMSIIEHVDKVLLWDTGSTDKTKDIIKEIVKAGPGKVNFREYGSVDVYSFTKIRQEMLDATDTDWFIVVDGDEIWWEDSIKKVVEVVKSSRSRNLESIVVSTINLIGDIYHYQEEQAGQYNLAGRRGHYNLRVVNKSIPGLHSYGPHGVWGWVDRDNKMIQDRDPKKILFAEAPYLHATFLRRSFGGRDEDVPKRKKKLKHELGIPFPLDFYYPDVLFRERPSIVPSVWEKRSRSYSIRAGIETPFKKLRRRLRLGMPVGY